MMDIRQSGSSPLDRALDAMSAGDRGLGIAVESSKCIKAGFAFERT